MIDECRHVVVELPCHTKSNTTTEREQILSNHHFILHKRDAFKKGKRNQSILV
jgi:hypothetical protein